MRSRPRRECTKSKLAGRLIAISRRPVFVYGLLRRDVWIGADAETAEAVMEQASPQAVVLDLLLPGLQGEDFLKRHRAANKAIRTVVVVMVKDLSATELAALHALGVTAVLRKRSHVAKDAVDLITKAIVTKAIVAKAS
jgi:CheY-like chemotaxis protein